MEINGAASAGNEVEVIERSEAGFGSLSSEGFLKLLITQLQNQDPSEPISNEELLNQIASMRDLQSNIELSDTLKSLTSNQQLSTAATFIGKTVSGAAGDDQISGTVERAFLRDGKAYVDVAGSELPLDSITDVAA